MHIKYSVVIVLVSGFLVGCGGGKEPAPAAAPAPGPKSTPSAMPPLAPGPGSTAPGAMAKPSEAPPPTAFDFAAAARPLDKSGQALSDLQMLNQAIMYYSTTKMPHAGVDTSKAKNVNEAAALMAARSAGPPPLKSLTELVKAGVIKSLPIPPPGKEYVLDPKTQLAVLVDKK